MKRISTILVALLAVCSLWAQNMGSCEYQPALSKPMHRPDTVLVTFKDYKSVRLTNPESAFMFVYRTSLEKQYGNNSMSACEYYGTKNNMKALGNVLQIVPRKYAAPSGGDSNLRNKAPRRKAWGTGGDTDALRFVIPAGTLTACDNNGVEHVLDSISFKYDYTDQEDPDRVEHSPFEYILTPASGEEVKSLGEFLLEFPYCQGIFTLNYDQAENPYILNAKGEVVTTGQRSVSMDVDYAGKITLKNRVITAGEYTLVVPAGSYHMSTSMEAWDDSICHPEIRAVYKVLGEESMAWESVPAHGKTATTFDGIYLSFPGKTIASRVTNLGGGNLKVFMVGDDKYPALNFNYYFSKITDNRLCFTTASEVKKIKDGASYYFEVPYGLVTFSDGTVSDAFRVEFTYDTTYQPGSTEEPGTGEEPGSTEDPGTTDEPGTEIDVTVEKVADNYVGYTTSAVYRKNGVRFNSGSEQGMLIRLPKEKTALLAGSKIKAIRTATGTTQMENPRLVIIEGDDASVTPVVEQATSKFSTSMKDYALDTPYEIKGDKALLVGIKCSLNAAYSPMLFDETLDLPEGYAWALTADGWTDISRKGYGAPNIQVLVDENPVLEDVLVKPFFTGVYNKMGSPMTISTEVLNYGAKEVNDFEVTYKIGQAAEVSKHIEGISLKQGEVYELVIDNIDVPAAGLLNLDVKVTRVNGKQDAETGDNAQSSQPYIYPADVQKKILFEEFTGMNCVNCPGAVIAVEQVLSEYPGQYVEVYHHAGYEPDNFTLDEDLEYTWFYNNGGSTYAPGGMVNRRAANAEATSVVFQSNEVAKVRAAVTAALNVAPYVGIGMDNVYDDASRSGKVTIDVHCYEVPTDETHTLNVWLIQDNVMRYQKGAGVVAHDNAMRMSLTGKWGMQIELKPGADNSYTFEYTIPHSITSEYAQNVFGAASEVDDKDVVAIPPYMRLVAFVSDFTQSALTRYVWNVEECKVTDLEGGVIEDAINVIGSTPRKTVTYDLQGRRVQETKHGVYIIGGKKVLR